MPNDCVSEVRLYDDKRIRLILVSMFFKMAMGVLIMQDYQFLPNQILTAIIGSSNATRPMCVWINHLFAILWRNAWTVQMKRGAVSLLPLFSLTTRGIGFSEQNCVCLIKIRTFYRLF